MLIEFIAFVLTMLILIYMMGRRAKEERRKMRDPEYVRKQQDAKKRLLRELTQAFEIEEEEEEEGRKPPPPLESLKILPSMPVSSIPKIKERQKYDFVTSFKEYRPASAIEKRQLTPSITEETIRIADEPVVSSDLTFGDQQAYQIKQEEKTSRIREEVKSLPSRRKMLVYHIIFGRPKAFRPFESQEFPMIE